MASTDFAVFDLGGTNEVVLPQPDEATWDQPVVGESFGRVPRYDYFKVVTWSWRNLPLSTAHYDAIVNKRNALSGKIRFRTLNRQGQMVQCTGVTDQYPGGVRKNGDWYGITVQFWMVEEV